MTNYEKHKTKIDKIWESGSDIAIVDDEVKPCSETKCVDCDLFKNEEKCSVQAMAKWLMAEYKEQGID